MGQAMDKALNVISDAFRPERKGANQRMIECCRLMEMVQSHRFTFPQALEKLDTQVGFILEGIAFLELDNSYLNKKHGTDSFHLADYQITARDWLKRVTGEF